MHHNNLKYCVLPSGTGTTHYPLPEAEGTTILFENDPTNAEGEREAPPPKRARPARLRQNINLPLRFGDFVAH